MYTGYSPPRPKFPSVLLHDQPFSRYRLAKHRTAPNNPRMTLITEMSKIPCVHWILTPEAQISLCFALRPAVFKIQVFQKSKCTEWPQNDLKHLRVKSTLCTLNTNLWGPKFHSVSLYDQSFPRYRIFKNRKCAQWPQNDLNHWSVKCTLCTLNTHPWGSNFTLFCSTVARFPDNWGFCFPDRVQWWN